MIFDAFLSFSRLYKSPKSKKISTSPILITRNYSQTNSHTQSELNRSNISKLRPSSTSVKLSLCNSCSSTIRVCLVRFYREGNETVSPLSARLDVVYSYLNRWKALFHSYFHSIHLNDKNGNQQNKEEVMTSISEDEHCSTTHKQESHSIWNSGQILGMSWGFSVNEVHSQPMVTQWYQATLTRLQNHKHFLLIHKNIAKWNNTI